MCREFNVKADRTCCTSKADTDVDILVRSLGISRPLSVRLQSLASCSHFLLRIVQICYASCFVRPVTHGKPTCMAPSGIRPHFNHLPIFVGTTAVLFTTPVQRNTCIGIVLQVA